VKFFVWLLFYPTLWWNLLLNRFIGQKRRWWDWVDDDVLLGALPFPADVPKLKSIGIGAVINTCCEYAGPLELYAQAGIETLYIPTIDFTPPSIEDLRTAVAFMHAQIAKGRKVYVHCKAGRGRSATVVMCYLISKGMTANAAQKLLLEKRPHVMADLEERTVVKQFAEEFMGGIRTPVK
jgi:atypical dual specificity phosphatase